jgi:predicted DsbA family dithiol-disulfide isomerase
LHFTRGGNIADVDQLAEEAAAVGMDRARARAYLDSDEGLSELQAELEAARELGIRAVPTYVFDGKWAIQGAQPVENFTEALARGLEQSAGR